MKNNKKTGMQDIIFLALPILLWPIVFLVFKNSFVYAMAAATAFLALLSLLKYRDLIKWKGPSPAKMAAFAIAGAIILYLVFYGGFYLASMLGMLQDVRLVYTMIYAEGSKLGIFILLAIIGICEEIYWRGALQGYMRRKFSKTKWAPWVIATAYYSLVHLSTLNPILVLAAFFVGLTASLIAEKHGIIASAAVHIIWIEAIIIFLPVIVIH